MKPTQGHATNGSVRVAVCIATRRRPGLLQRLLHSVERAKGRLDQRWDVKAYVVDNDPDRSAISTLGDPPSWIRIFHEPREGIPFARNRALRKALPWANWIAFVDDDERVSEGWLEHLLTYARVSGAAVVAGPVVPEFECEPPHWVHEVGLLARPRHRTGHRLRTARSGNLLVRADVLRGLDRLFDTRLAHVGGSDTELTGRIAVKHPIVWCDEAIVYEWVPQSRMTFRWHVRRSLRIGANRIDRADLAPTRGARSWIRSAYIGGAAAELLFGAVVAASAILRGYPPAIKGALRIVRAVGTFARAIGIEIREYPPTPCNSLTYSTGESNLDFIVGCGRSGTTLLRAMLDAHPDIAVPGETHFVPSFLKRFGSDRPLRGRERTAAIEYLATNDRLRRWDLDTRRLRDRLEELRSPLGSEVVETAFALYAEIHDAVRYMDKTPEYVRSIELLSAAFPGSRFVHVIRDPRDTAASLVDATWGPTDYASALRFWKKRVVSGRRAAQRLEDDRYLEVHYEQLIDDPSTVLRQVCDFLQAPFEPSMTTYWRGERAAGEDARSPADHENLSRPPQKVRDWRVSLSKRDQVLADVLLGDLIERAGYQPSGIPIGFGDRLYCVGRWMRSWFSDVLRWVRTYRPPHRR